MNKSMVYNLEQKNEFLKLFDNIQKVHKKGTKKNYFNLAVSFDIETSSIYLDDDNKNIDISRLSDKDIKSLQKCSNMYIWQMAVNDNVIYGRYWKEFISLLNDISNYINSNIENILVIYVHNLSYEFQYFYKLFEWFNDGVFAIKERKPIYALNIKGIEFRCSYLLSGYSLKKVAENLQEKNIKKLVGDLDYSLVRHNQTELTSEELQYCLNDVLIVTQYINEQIKYYGDITKIPLTQTGKARVYTRDKCFENKSYKYFIKGLTLTSAEFELLRKCYSGGFTHSNIVNTNRKLSDVSSYDFTSSYPYVMLSEKFPISKGKKISITDKDIFENCLKNYCCLFELHIENVHVKKNAYDNILQFSKCFNIKDYLSNNGRIVKARKLDTVVNEIDFKNICDFYTFNNIKIGDFYVYEKGYLPVEIIQAVLKLYNDKTKLKGVEEKEVEYMHGKELLNSLYGMAVTNTMKEDILFVNGNWCKDDNFNLDDKIKKYNDDRNRFLFYPWGVWITSYARKNLFSGILECKSDYIYSDTDSIKIKNAENHKQYFDDYNKNVVKKLQKMCEHYNLDFELCKPKTIEGKEKLIGIWDYEGTYKNFKTLGAKRYLVESYDGKYQITIAGLPKNAVTYMEEKSKEYNMDIFDFFNDGMYIPDSATGKNTHIYIDDSIECKITDYKGKEIKCFCPSGVHLSKCEFELKLTPSYLDLILNSKYVIDMR